MADDINSSKHFKRLDDGRYLFRAGRWSRTVVLDAETAQRVHEGRERFIRHATIRASIWGAMGIPLGRGIARSGESLASFLIAGVVLSAIALWEYFARERAYHKWVRSAPTSDRSFPVPYGFKERFRRITAEQPLYRPVLITVFGIPATLFLLLLQLEQTKFTLL